MTCAFCNLTLANRKITNQILSNRRQIERCRKIDERYWCVNKTLFLYIYAYNADQFEFKLYEIWTFLNFEVGEYHIFEFMIMLLMKMCVLNML